MEKLGGNISPQLFEKQINFLADRFEFVSLKEGLSRRLKGSIDKPIFSVTFDDGFKSVQENALPILKKREITGAQAINSSFMQGEDTFWRIKLGAILNTNACDQLKTFLIPLGYKDDQSIFNFTLDHFSKEIVATISQIYEEAVSDDVKTQAKDLFDNPTAINQLAKENWEICNHTKNHFPVTESTGIHLMQEEFDTCESEIKEATGVAPQFWVIPFERVDKRAPNLLETFETIAPKDTVLVFAGNKINKSANSNQRTIFRIAPPNVTGASLIRFLGKLR